MPSTDRRTSRRHRRLRVTAALLAAGVLASLVAWVVIVRYRRATTYQTAETHPEITRRLARELPDDAPDPRFTDVTAAAGLASFVSFSGQRTSQLPEDMGAGAAWGDYDNDGDDDLFLVSAGGPLDGPPDALAPSQLYENQGDGRFRRVETFPEPRIVGMSAAWGDADGDGWLDLVVTGYGVLQLYRNEAGRLVEDAALGDLEGFWAGASWGDFDNDRDLDLYVCGYVQYQADVADRARGSTQYGNSVPFTLNPASYPPERNLLFRNDGHGTFTEVAETLGVANPEGRSLTALWHDVDADGWLDLYVANDVSDNVLFMNWDGRFEDTSHAAYVADYRGAMGLTAGDWNRDGDMDLFVTHWVAQENALYDSQLNDFGAGLGEANGAPGTAQRTGTSTGSSGRGIQFMDVASQRGLGQIAIPMVGWGAEFADLDADGWLDLVVANGSTFETDETPPALVPQPTFLFWNRRGEHFHDLSARSELLQTPRVGRGLALSDYDGDGDLDVLIVDRAAGALLLRNEMQTGHWVEIRLQARRQPDGPLGPADGASVVARAGDDVFRRSVSSASYLSQSSRTLHIGLGHHTTIDSVEVLWPGGQPSVYPGLEADRIWNLIEGDPTPHPSIAGGPALSAGSPPSPVAPRARERTLAFWAAHRGAMDAMQRDGNLPLAIDRFREALAINPAHEDARYHLANSLAATGDVTGALEELETLARVNPQSLRAYRQGGLLRARVATTDAELDTAQELLRRALTINPEETGALLLLGEVELMARRFDEAEEHLALATRTNTRAVGGYFLLAYLAWTRGEEDAARDHLVRARDARGDAEAPEGTTSEGDVVRQMHEDDTPLARFWGDWDGDPTLPDSFERLETFLRDRRAAARPPG